MKDDGTKDYMYVNYILECIEKIQKWSASGKDEFINNEMLQDAMIRNLHVMAESTQRLSQKVKAKYPEISWAQIAGFRNVVVHDYMALEVDEIWDSIENDIPPLKTAMEKLLKEMPYDNRN